MYHPQWGFNLSDIVKVVSEAGFEVDADAAARAVEKAAAMAAETAAVP